MCTTLAYSTTIFPESAFTLVESSVKALQGYGTMGDYPAVRQLVLWWRRQCLGRRIAQEYDVQCSNEEIASALASVDDERLRKKFNAGIWKQFQM